MGVVVGPVLARPGGFAFDIWTLEGGLTPGYVYRRIGDTYHARQAAINSAVNDRVAHDRVAHDRVSRAGVRACDTLEQFTSELVQRGGLLRDSALRVLRTLRAA
jgi:hypothetical protein